MVDAEALPLPTANCSVKLTAGHYCSDLVRAGPTPHHILNRVSTIAAPGGGKKNGAEAASGLWKRGSAEHAG